MNLTKIATPTLMVLIAGALLGTASLAHGDDQACKAIVDGLESEIGKFSLVKRTDQGNGAGSSAAFSYTAGSRADVMVFIYDRNLDKLGEGILEEEFNRAHKKIVADQSGRNEFAVASTGKASATAEGITYEGVYTMTLPNGIKLVNLMLLRRHGEKLLKMAITTNPETLPPLRADLEELAKHCAARLAPPPWR